MNVSPALQASLRRGGGGGGGVLKEFSGGNVPLEPWNP